MCARVVCAFAGTARGVMRCATGGRGPRKKIHLLRGIYIGGDHGDIKSSGYSGLRGR